MIYRFSLEKAMRVEMTSHDLNDRVISRLLDVERITAWDHADAVAALRHQLAAKLLPDLELPREAAIVSASSRTCPRSGEASMRVSSLRSANRSNG